jgi:hypothetical protein
VSTIQSSALSVEMRVNSAVTIASSSEPSVKCCDERAQRARSAHRSSSEMGGFVLKISVAIGFPLTVAGG